MTQNLFIRFLTRKFNTSSPLPWPPWPPRPPPPWLSAAAPAPSRPSPPPSQPLLPTDRWQCPGFAGKCGSSGVGEDPHRESGFDNVRVSGDQGLGDQEDMGLETKQSEWSVARS